MRLRQNLSPIRAAVDSGVNVIIMNSGTPEQARDVGALMYVGQPELCRLPARKRGRRAIVRVREPLYRPARLDRAVQAYLPMVILANDDRYGVLPGNNINSGPGFVTADGLAKVEEFAGEYR